jgi:hypothetical protein
VLKHKHNLKQNTTREGKLNFVYPSAISIRHTGPIFFLTFGLINIAFCYIRDEFKCNDFMLIHSCILLGNLNDCGRLI